MIDAFSSYQELIQLLERHGARYRLIDHDPEGRTEIVSRLRGNQLHAAAKCMVVMVKITKKQKEYVLAVVPGDRRVDLAALRTRKSVRYAGFANPDIAEDLSGCAVGTILPFAWTDHLELIVDPDICANDEIFFNAGRLDRSIALDTNDYRRIASPTEASISTVT